MHLRAVHETVEETVVDPVARRELEGDELVVEQRVEEEDRAKEQLAELHDPGVAARSSTADGVYLPSADPDVVSYR